MIALDLLWWVGWVWFAAWAALPLTLVPVLGPFAGTVVAALLAPWSALLGMALAHRLLPPAEEGTFRLFADRGSTRWALKGWAPSVYLAVFQPVFLLIPSFQRIALGAFGARLASGAQVTSRTRIREPHLVEIGSGSLVGEFAHLVCSYQPRPRCLVVARIQIDDEVLIGAYSVLCAGCRVGTGTIVEYHVSIGAGTTIGEGSRIGAGTLILNHVRIGRRVRVGKSCVIPTGAEIPDGTRLADGTVWSETPAFAIAGER